MNASSKCFCLGDALIASLGSADMQMDLQWEAPIISRSVSSLCAVSANE